MKILYITQTPPELKGNGTEQRTHRLWLKLREMGDVDVVNWGEFRRRNILDAIFRRLFRPAELPCFSLSGRSCERRFQGYDLVVTRYLNTAARARAWEIAPCKVDVDDLPSEACRTVWSNSWPIGFRWIPRCVVSRWEKRVLRKLSGAWVANACDAEKVSKYCPCEIFENDPLPPSAEYQATGRQKRILMTVGSVGYPPNFEGICWFVRNVWAEIRSRHPDWEYHVAGKDGDSLPKDVKASGVKVLGYVQDIDALYEKVAGVLAPVLAGAGTSIKVREALSRDRKVFATSFASRGVTGSGNLVVCDTVGDMISAIDGWMAEFDAGVRA